VTFSPDGDAFQMSFSLDDTDPHRQAMLVSRSADGG